MDRIRSRFLPKRNPGHDQRQRWETVLRNHRRGIAGMDFIVIRINHDESLSGDIVVTEAAAICAYLADRFHEQ